MVEPPKPAVSSKNNRLRKIAKWPLTRLVLTLVFMFLLAAILIPFFVSFGLLFETSDPLFDLLVTEIVLSVIVLTAIYVVTRWLDKETMVEAGYGLNGAVAETMAGFGLGAVLMTVATLILVIGGWYKVETIASLRVAGAGIAMGFLVHFFVGVFEEALFRGVIFRFVELGMGSLIALLASSAIFGWVHIGNPDATLWGATAIALEAGVLLGAVYMFTRRLWMAVGLHWSWNAFQGAIFGFEVSGSGIEQESLLVPEIKGPELLTGGDFGLEASIFTVILCVGVGFWFVWQAWKRGHWITPLWMKKRVVSE